MNIEAQKISGLISLDLWTLNNQQHPSSKIQGPMLSSPSPPRLLPLTAVLELVWLRARGAPPRATGLCCFCDVYCGIGFGYGQ
jgi:hypothetical protein